VPDIKPMNNCFGGNVPVGMWEETEETEEGEEEVNRAPANAEVY
jgi:hypothetical protein